MANANNFAYACIQLWNEELWLRLEPASLDKSLMP